jgi:GAF domain-containing protein
MASGGSVAFPVIGSPMPTLVDPGTGRFLDSETFLDLVAQDYPHWLYHLHIAKARRGTFHSDFAPVSRELLQQLAGFLGLDCGFRVKPLEFIHGALPGPGERSPYAFGYPAEFNADSCYLALVVGLVAAATRRPLPPTVLLSGCDRRRGQRPGLAGTGDIEKKVLLSLGLDPGYIAQPLVNQLYGHPATERVLGPPEGRVRQASVKLFLIPTDVDTDPREFGDPLVTDPVADISLERFGQPDVGAVLAQVKELAPDAMLLVQVPTAFHALYLLGYHHAHPLIRNRVGPHLWDPLPVFRVRHQLQGAGAQGRHSPGPDLLPELAQLEFRLNEARGKDIYTRLNIILEQCMKRLHCHAGGAVVVVDPLNPDWLRVFARKSPGATRLPHFVPCSVGITGRVVRTGETVTLDRTAASDDYQAALADTNPLSDRYPPEVWQQYQAFLREMKSCVVMPLRYGGKTLGVICLHRDREGAFNPNMVRLVEGLVERAAAEVAAFLEDERRNLQRMPPLTGPGSVEDLAGRVASLPRAGAQAELGQELARLALARSGAYRTIVRLITPDHHSLVAIGMDAADPASLEPFRTTLFPLTQGSAARHAIESGRSYIVPDTQQTGIHFHPVPPTAAAHASILLRASNHVLGVLSLDWDRPEACDAPLQATLEDLAGRYALALKAFSTDDLFAAVDRLCTAAAQPDVEPDCAGFLELVARMVGGRQGALFLYRPETGRLHHAANLLHPDWSADEHWYEVGEGVTGWVARYRRPVRLHDMRDAGERARLAQPGEEPPDWKHKYYDGEPFGGHNFTYLGVPLVVGDELLGVLRMTSTHYDTGFSNYDQQVALAAAARLAGCLYQRRLGRQATIKQALDRLVQHALGAMVEALGTTSEPDPSAAVEAAPDAEHTLLGVVAEIVGAMTGAEQGWAWAIEQAAGWHLVHEWGPTPSETRVLSPEALLEELQGHGYLVFAPPAPGTQPPAAVPTGAPEHPSLPEGCQLAVLVLRAAGQPAALFAYLVKSPHPLQAACLEPAAHILDWAGELLLLVRRFTERVRRVPARELPPAMPET